MTDVTVESWAQLQEELFRDSWHDGINRYRSPFVFRGLSNADYPLETSLFRLGGDFATLEPHLLRNFRKYSQNEGRSYDSFWHLLAMAQHHGLPTRLMDWTYSPYVALHFATANLDRFSEDGVIWVVDFHQAHEQVHPVLRAMLHEDGAQAFTVDLLTSLRQNGRADSVSSAFHTLAQGLEEFDRLGELQPFLLFLEPPSITARIVNQFALFSVMPDPQMVVSDWLADRPQLMRRIIVPAELKWECRDKLDQCNITERVLFPGLDGLCSWLKRHYSPSANS